ncbi:MAG: adenylate/guanylate cyclase domain-containing protein [Verrucomicrobiota bacterium JB022]|nr:adenylate/guanylate cyclase domain-containing protein [Verrucomicrobiota bacterium JB022]
MIDLRKSLRKHGHVLWLPLVPVLWMVLSSRGSLVDLKHLAMDTRYYVRGPLEAKEKVVYVNRDGRAAAVFGSSDFFPRYVYADCTRAVLELGGAKAVFLDFVLSVFSGGVAFDNRFLNEADQAMAGVVVDHPDRIVMAASYAGAQADLIQSDMYLPRMANGPHSPDNPTGYDPVANPIPELPQFPFWVPDLQSPDGYPPPQGRVGLINTEVELDQGPVPRYVPTFVELENDRLSKHYLLGFMYWLRKTTDAAEVGDDFYQTIQSLDIHPSETGDRLVIRDADGLDFGSAPLTSTHVFYTVAIELFRATHPGTEIEIGADELLLYVPDGESRRLAVSVPLVESQAMEINWFSGWLEEDVQRGRRPALEDRYNPQVSMADVYGLYHVWQNPSAANLRQSRLEMFARWSLWSDPEGADDTTSYASDEAVRQGIEHWFRRHFQGTAVLMGPTDVLLQDLAPTPFDPGEVPKVSVHGNAYKTIVSGRFIHRLPAWADWIFTFALTGCVTALTMVGGSKTRLNKIAAMVLLVGYVVGSLELFRYFDLVVPLVAPLGAALSTSMLGAVVQLIREEQHKSRIQGMFGSYVSPKVVQRLVDADEPPQLGGQALEITAFFSDIQSFSSFSEVLTPDELVVLMNEYLNAMTEIMEAEEGTLDKYIGDAIVAMFGAPVRTDRHAYQACRTAVLIQQRQAELRDYWKGLGDRWPSLVHHMQTRIGLNTGPAVVGNMGSRKRFNYTMMGDTVNLAARNESGAKAYGVHIMVSEDTRDQALRQGDDLVFRYLDRIVVKGRSRPVGVYELVGFRDSLSANAFRCLELYQQAVEHYLRQEWSRAQELFLAAAACEPFQPDAERRIDTNPSLVMAARCDYWRHHPPPADWDGRWIMKSK